MGLVSKDAQKAWRTAGRELDKKVEGFIFGEKESQITTKRRGSFRTGGPAVNVPNAPARPEERVNKNTGVPYDLEAGPTAQPEKNRSGLSEEGKLLATLQRRQKKIVYKYFSEDELKCRHTGQCDMDWAFMQTIERIRERCGFPFKVSGCLSFH